MWHINFSYYCYRFLHIITSIVPSIGTRVPPMSSLHRAWLISQRDILFFQSIFLIPTELVTTEHGDVGAFIKSFSLLLRLSNLVFFFNFFPRRTPVLDSHRSIAAE